MYGLDKSDFHFVTRVLIVLSNILESKNLLLVDRKLWLIDGLVPRLKRILHGTDAACIEYPEWQSSCSHP